MKKFIISFVLTLFAILASVDAVFKGANVQDRGLVKWYVQVETYRTNGDELLCGGALVRPGAVLTGASCLGDNIASNTAAYSGYLNYKLGRSTARFLIPHQSYNAAENIFNIAIIILMIPYVLSSSIGVVSLPTPTEQYPLILAGMYGHGQIGNSDYSTIIRKGVGTTQYNIMCTINSYGVPLAREFDLCTNRYVTLTDGIGIMCDGDEGGPLVVEGNDTLIGLYKFLSGGVAGAGRDCEVATLANAPFPVFERVTKHVDWINEKLRSFGQ